MERDVQVVVIDRDEENVERLMEDGHYAIFGDATEDSVLEAGAAKASGLATVLGVMPKTSTWCFRHVY